MFGDLLNIAAFLIQDPNQIVNVQNPFVGSPFSFVFGFVVISPSFGPFGPDSMLTVAVEDGGHGQRFGVIGEVLVGELLEDSPNLLII